MLAVHSIPFLSKLIVGSFSDLLYLDRSCGRSETYHFPFNFISFKIDLGSFKDCLHLWDIAIIEMKTTFHSIPFHPFLGWNNAVVRMKHITFHSISFKIDLGSFRYLILNRIVYSRNKTYHFLSKELV